MGERSPLWDSSARAVVLGLSLHHTRAHWIRAFLEGVAFALYNSFDVLLTNGLRMNGPLIFNEGGARSVLWRQIFTDVFGVPTAMIESRVGAPLGDAILAGVGVGVWEDFTIARRLARYAEHMEPDPGQHERYLELFELFKETYASLRGPFARLREIAAR
jgi:xylulokinase